MDGVDVHTPYINIGHAKQADGTEQLELELLHIRHITQTACTLNQIPAPSQMGRDVIILEFISKIITFVQQSGIPSPVT